MDARSSSAINTTKEKLLFVNSDIIQRRLNSIRALKPIVISTDGVIPEDFSGNQYRSHKKFSKLFYACLMAVYGDLVALQMLYNKKNDEKYLSLEKGVTHRIATLFDVMTRNDDGKERKADRLSKLAESYRDIINSFKHDLGQDQGLSSDFFLTQVAIIGSAYMDMSYVFLDEKIKMPEFRRRILFAALAFEFIFLVEFELRSLALKKASSFTKGKGCEFDVYEEIFIESEALSFIEPLRSYLQSIMSNIDEPAMVFEDLFKSFKAQAEMLTVEKTHEDDKQKNQTNDDDENAPIGNGSANAILSGSDHSQSQVESDWVIQGVIEAVPADVIDQFGETFKERVKGLIERYFCPNGEFSKIKLVVKALETGDDLILHKDDRIVIYFDYLKKLESELEPEPAPAPEPAPEQELAPAPEPAPARRPTPARTRMPARRPTPARKPIPVFEKVSREESEDSSVDNEIDGVLDQLSPQVKVAAPTHPLSQPDTHADSQESDSEEDQQGRERRQLIQITPEDKELIEEKHKKLQQAGVKSTTVIYPRPSRLNHELSLEQPKYFAPRPSPLKYIVLGVGIGLMIAAGVVLGVALAYLLIHGAAPALAVAFIATSKIVGGSSIATWSVVAGILSFPPVVGLFAAFKHWQKKCLDFKSGGVKPTIAVVPQRRSMPFPAEIQLQPSNAPVMGVGGLRNPEKKAAGLAGNVNALFAPPKGEGKPLVRKAAIFIPAEIPARKRPSLGG